MSDISWPESLPLPRQTGYSGSSKPRHLRTEMESGRPRMTRLSSSRLDNVSINLVVNSDQFAEFMTFYDETSIGGTAWFDMVLDTGQGPVIHEVRIVDQYRYQLVGVVKNVRMYTLKFDVETDQRNAVL